MGGQQFRTAFQNVWLREKRWTEPLPVAPRAQRRRRYGEDAKVPQPRPHRPDPGVRGAEVLHPPAHNRGVRRLPPGRRREGQVADEPLPLRGMGR